jgi:hypothetical protein
MSDDDYTAALCRLTALNEEQLDGLDRLAQFSVDELADFTQAVKDAWNANRFEIELAKAEVIRLRRAQAATEVRVGNAARRRNSQYPLFTDAEIAELQRSREAVEEAKHSLILAGQQFKAGVTEEQLTAALG